MFQKTEGVTPACLIENELQDGFATDGSKMLPKKSCATSNCKAITDSRGCSLGTIEAEASGRQHLCVIQGDTGNSSS